ncbi:hypothetical protein G3578_01935 [Brevibacillus sp. SYP-B805]|nr:hypothetical protein [Brevibacillus sp. SYP-B805]NGQ93932.1 hypothetical protein [Brevibacillus sp. SYP-B805]
MAWKFYPTNFYWWVNKGADLVEHFFDAYAIRYRSFETAGWRGNGMIY